VRESLPSLAAGGFAEALEKQFAVVVFAGDIEYFFSTRAFKDLVESVKFGRLRKVGKITSVENQVRLPDGGVDLVYGYYRCTGPLHVLQKTPAVYVVDEFGIISFPFR
jgi:hypothetical protein